MKTDSLFVIAHHPETSRTKSQNVLTYILSLPAVEVKVIDTT
ncbi:hypothetical protein [Oceanobacillus massiliensis]|nr:hypothetical protein [Oceanobacillus massiliensis]